VLQCFPTAEKLARYLPKLLPTPPFTMLRTTTTRPILKGLNKVSSTRSSYSIAATVSSKINTTCRFSSNQRPRPIVPIFFRPATSVLRYATASKPPFDRIDKEAEKKILEKEIPAHPESVSGTSSTRQVFEGRAGQGERGDDGTDMLGGIKADIVSLFKTQNPIITMLYESLIFPQETIKETFALTDVPRESYYIGAAGVLPYVATSLSTVYLAWDINHAQASGTGTGVLFSPEFAHQLLSIIEPIQIGYGAVVSQTSQSIDLDSVRALSDTSPRLSPSSARSTGD
jgi:hypothetical protein